MRTVLRPLLRNKKVLLLIVLLVFLPAALLGAVATHWSSQTRLHDDTGPSPTREIASYVGANCHQDSHARIQDNCLQDPGFRPTITRQADALHSVLGEDSDIALSIFFPARLESSSGHYDLDAQQVDKSMLPHGFRSTSATGHLPGEGEIMLNAEVARELNVSPGDHVRLIPQGWDAYEKPITLQVSSTSGNKRATVLDGTVVSAEELSSYISPEWSAQWSLTYGKNVSEAIIPALNAQGFLLHSSRFAEPLDDGMGNLDFLFFFVILALIIAVVAILLISPAFTVLATRNARMFSLLASQGASPRQIRNGVIAFGVVVGFIGGLTGTGLGLLIGMMTWLRSHPMWWPVFPWPWLLLIVLVCVAGATMLALIPAIMVSRLALSQGIAGAAPDRIRRFRPWMLTGPVIAFIGMAICFTNQRVVSSASVGLGGILVLIIGSAASTPLLLYSLSKLLQRGPLALRMSRQALVRQSLRSVSVTAALGTLVGVCGFWYVHSVESNRSYNDFSIPVYDSSTLLLQPFPALGVPSAVDDSKPDPLDSLTHQAEKLLPDATRTEITTAPSVSVTVYDGSWCSLDDNDHLNPDRAALCRTELREAQSSTWINQTIIATPDIADAFWMSPEERDAAIRVLDHGGLLISRDLQGYFGGVTGHVPLRITSYQMVDNAPGKDIEDKPEAAAVLPPSRDVVLSPALAERYGIEPEERGILFHHSSLSKKDFENAAETLQEEANKSIPPNSVLLLNREDHSIAHGFILLAGLTLGILILSTLSLVLARQELKRQYQLLDALGSPPSFARKVNATYSALTAGAAALLGAIFMLLAFSAEAHGSIVDIDGYVLRAGSFGLAIGPLSVMLLILLTAPLSGALVGWLGTGKISPMLSRPD